MSASKCIGRIGGLTVALGLGAALTTGTGVAWAGTPGSEQSSSTVEHKLRSRISEARESLSSRDSAEKADSAAGRRALVAGAALTRAKGLSEAAHEASDQAQKVSGEIRDTITDRLKRTVTGKVFGRDPESDPEFELTTAPDLTPTPKPAVVIRNPEIPTRSNGYSSTSAVRAPLVDRLPSLRASIPDAKAAVEAAVDGISQNGTRAAEALTVARETFAAPAVTDIGSALAPAAARFTMKAIDTQVEAPKAPVLVSSLLAVVGLAPLAANSPLAPATTPALLTLMAWARREFDKGINPNGTVVQTMALVEPTAAVIVDPNLQTPKPAAPVVGNTIELPRNVTGPLITTAPYGEPGNYGIAGTDLGIMWDDGDGHILMLFGDTFDQEGMQGVWRSNVLLRTTDTDLSDGIQIDDAVISPDNDYSQNTWSSNYGATQVIRDPGFLGLFGSTTTIIPTAAISVTDDETGKTTQYANVMSVRTWDTPGQWTTNWSAIAYSEDGGKTWTVDPNTVRSSGWLRSSTPYVPGNNHFQQGAFVMGQEGDVNADGVRYVYSYGTPSGRSGSAYVARVPQDEIRNLAAYEYWAGDDRGWVANDPSAAVPVIGATDTKPQTGILGWISKTITDILGGIVVGGSDNGNVGEMSVQYNEYLQKYVVLYTDGGNNVVMRVSDSPQGQWSDPTVLVANDLGENTGMYAPMIHPWSGTDALGADNEQYLYYNLSYWGDYNVRTMRTDLSGPATNSNSGTIAV